MAINNNLLKSKPNNTASTLHWSSQIHTSLSKTLSITFKEYREHLSPFAAGDKTATIHRFAKNYKRLSPSAQKRLTVENDDIPTSYSITDLKLLHELTGIPLVFDFHHHQFCPGRFQNDCIQLRLGLDLFTEGRRAY